MDNKFFGHIVFGHDFLLDDDLILMTARFSGIPELEVYLEFKRDTPRHVVRSALVKDLKETFYKIVATFCKDCVHKKEALAASYFVSTTSGDAALVIRGANKIEFKPWFNFTETNRKLISPLFNKWIKENRDN